MPPGLAGVAAQGLRIKPKYPPLIRSSSPTILVPIGIAQRYQWFVKPYPQGLLRRELRH